MKRTKKEWEERTEDDGRRVFTGTKPEHSGSRVVIHPGGKVSVVCGRMGKAAEYQHHLALHRKALANDEEALEQREPSAVMEALGDHALIAIEMLEALRDGDSNYFGRLKKAMDKPKEGLERVEGERKWTPLDSDLIAAIRLAFAEKQSVPSDQEVGVMLAKVLKSNGLAASANTGRQDKVKKRLNEIGFGWIPSDPQGFQARK